MDYHNRIRINKYHNGRPIKRISEDENLNYQYGYDSKGRLIEVIDKEGKGAGELSFYREDEYLPYAFTFTFNAEPKGTEVFANGFRFKKHD